MHLRETIEAYKRNDPAARNALEIILLYNGFHATFWYRIAHWLWQRHLRFLARLISQLTKFFTGVEIHPAAKIGLPVRDRSWHGDCHWRHCRGGRRLPALSGCDTGWYGQGYREAPSDFGK